MKNIIQQHIIDKQYINITIDGNITQSELKILQEQLVHTYKTKIGEELDRIFTRLVPPDIHVRLEKLEIELPTIQITSLSDVANFAKIVEREFNKKAEKIIRDKILKASDGTLEKSSSGKDLQVSKWAIMETFLEEGTYPPWASARNLSADKIFEELINKSPSKMADIIIRLSKKSNKKLIDRIIYQFRPKYIERLLSVLFQKHGRSALKQLSTIRRRLGQRYKSMRGQKSVDKAILSAAFEYVLEQYAKNSRVKYNEKDFIQHVVEVIQSKYKHVSEDDLVRESDAVKPEFNTQYSDLDVLEYFLQYGSVPYWAGTESRSSMQNLLESLLNKRLVPLQRMIEKNLGDSNFLQRLVMQFSTEHIFRLLEPLADDHLRFLENTLREFKGLSQRLAGLTETQGQQALKQAAIEFLTRQRGRFSKEDITRLALEKAAAYARSTFHEAVESFYGHLQQASATQYDLTRSELIRALNEIDPQLSGQLETSAREKRVLKTEEAQLLQEIENLREQIKAEGLSESDLSRLNKERKQLRKRLKALRDRMSNLGVATADSVSAFHEQKSELERKLTLVQQEIQRGTDLHQAEMEELQQERNELREELRLLGDNFQRLQDKLLKDFDKAATPAQRQKLLNEFERAIALILRDRNRLQIRLTEILAASEQTLDAKKQRKLHKQEKRITEEIKKLDAQLEKLEPVEAALKTEMEESAQATETPSATSKLDFMLFFLQYGSTPWWAEEYRNSSVQDIFEEFAKDSPDKLRHAFARIGRNPVVWQRLVNQLNNEVLERILITLFPNFAGFAISTALLLEKIIDAKIIGTLERVSARYFKWSKVVEMLFTTPSSLSPSSFVRDVALAVAREFSISPSTLLEYMTNLSNNNPGTRLSIFADIISPIKDTEEVLNTEKELLEVAFRKQEEESGRVLPEDKKYDTLADYLLRNKYSDAAVKAGYSSASKMEALLLELLEKQPAATLKLLEAAIANPHARRVFIMEMSDSTFWEIVLLVGAKTMPLIRRYIIDLGQALGDERMLMAREALLRYIRESGDKPFLIRDYLHILLQDATKATQRQKIAILNEWKRKLSEVKDAESSLILSIMLAEKLDMKERLDASGDKSEQDNLKDQMTVLELEYRQQSQRLVFVLNREQAQTQGLTEIPSNLTELYALIEKTTADIKRLRDSIVENAKGEQALEQIMSWRQIAQLEGQLELLQQAEPFAVRRLRDRKSETESHLKALEADLQKLLSARPPALPPAPEDSDLEQLSDLMGSPQFRTRLLGLSEAERADWVEFAKEMGLDDLIDQWGLRDEKDDFLRALSDSSLEELQAHWEELPDKNDERYRRLQSRLKVLLTRRLGELRHKQRALMRQFEEASTEDAVDALRRQLLTIELQQNDILNEFFAAPLDNNLRQALQRVKTNIQAIFKRLRVAADRRKAELAEGQKTVLEEKIKVQRELVKKIEEEQKALTAVPELEKEKPQEKPVEQKKKPPKAIDETLYVRNAGMVLLSPYFNRLFTMTNLLEKNRFVSEEAQIRAVHLLQYVILGRTEHPENELVLNKIICGLPLDTPVPMDVGLTEEEKNACAALLQGTINNWPRMKTMTPDALRGTFLVREGSLTEEADRWKLKVEKGSFDMLLRTLPWAFSFIRHGWMPKFIMVEWELPGPS